MFISLFFLFVQILASAITDENCDYKKAETQKCFYNFFKLFNISTIPDFDDFGNIMSNITATEGWEGEEYICKNGMSLVNCINYNGISLTPECFSDIFDAETENSIGHVTNFYLIQYRCQGKGYQEFKDTYECAKTMKDCAGKTDSCLSIKKYIECMKKQATDKCGAEYSDFLTHSLQILLNVTYNYITAPATPQTPQTPQTPSNPSTSNLTVSLSITAVSILVALVIGSAIVMKCRHRKKKKKERKEFQDIYRMTAAIPQQTTNFHSNIFIPEPKISVDFEKILGHGSTATVYAAVITEQSKTITKQNAIKIPFQNRLDYVEEFNHELKIATILKNHSTICAAISWTLYRDLPCLIFEKMDIDLLSFVKAYNEQEKAKEFPPTKLFLQFLWQISDALSFIASKKLVHRDVAARNILIAYPNIAKISDFGLCSEFDVSSSVYLSPMFKKLPVKWLPPEALTERKFSENSDVWGFGITMHEMWTKGDLPYAKLNYNEQMEFLQSGQRLGIPNEMTEDIGEIMVSCWAENPEIRPSFEKLKQSFETLLEKETINYGYLCYDETK